MEESEDMNSRNSVKFHLSSKFVTQISIGAHHALGLFRIREWRTTPKVQISDFLGADFFVFLTLLFVYL